MRHGVVADEHRVAARRRAGVTPNNVTPLFRDLVEDGTDVDHIVVQVSQEVDRWAGRTNHDRRPELEGRGFRTNRSGIHGRDDHEPNLVTVCENGTVGRRCTDRNVHAEDLLPAVVNLRTQVADRGRLIGVVGDQTLGEVGLGVGRIE